MFGARITGPGFGFRGPAAQTQLRMLGGRQITKGGEKGRRLSEASLHDPMNEFDSGRRSRHLGPPGTAPLVQAQNRMF
jgi:hypothetical protein